MNSNCILTDLNKRPGLFHEREMKREKIFMRFLWEGDNGLRNIHICVKEGKRKKEKKECCLISEKKKFVQISKKII